MAKSSTFKRQKMIKEIYYSYFTLARLHALVKKIKELLAAKFPDHPMIATALAPFESQLAVALQAIGSSTKHALTKEVRLADSDRDDSYISMKDHVKAGLRRKNNSYREACEALWTVFEKNNTQLYRAADDDETAAIDSLVADLNKPQYQSHLATINAVDWLAELVRDNIKFTELSELRSADRSADDTVDDTKSFASLKQSTELLMNVLNSLYLMNEPSGIQEAVEKINQYIIEANSAAKQSKSRSKTKEEASQS